MGANSNYRIDAGELLGWVVNIGWVTGVLTKVDTKSKTFTVGDVELPLDVWPGVALLGKPAQDPPAFIARSEHVVMLVTAAEAELLAQAGAKVSGVVIQ